MKRFWVSWWTQLDPDALPIAEECTIWVTQNYYEDEELWLACCAIIDAQSAEVVLAYVRDRFPDHCGEPSREALEMCMRNAKNTHDRSMLERGLRFCLEKPHDYVPFGSVQSGAQRFAQPETLRIPVPRLLAR